MPSLNNVVVRALIAGGLFALLYFVISAGLPLSAGLALLYFLLGVAG